VPDLRNWRSSSGTKPYLGQSSGSVLSPFLRTLPVEDDNTSFTSSEIW
jgi:hypothetical protein